MFTSRRRLLSQNFLHDWKLTSSLLRGSSISKNDLVIEIGPGKGIITEQLIRQAEKVVAIEIDSDLFIHLKNKFRSIKNLDIYNADFLNSPLPTRTYKVFANIPFSIEGKIVRKLIDAKNPPEDAYLVMREELAARLAGINKESRFSIMHKPWFDFSIYHKFNGTDFTPATKVKSVMLRISKRTDPLIPWDKLKDYQKFIEIGFGQGTPLANNLKRNFGYGKTMYTLQKTGIAKKAKPGYLNLKQWLQLFTLFRN